MIKKPQTFEDLLELQKILDEEVAKKRDNGFIPRERNDYDIRLSLVAELIEFDEELQSTHKTWKQKEFNKQNAIIESVDVLFFFLQYINYLENKKVGGVKDLIKSCNNIIKRQPKKINAVGSFEILCLISNITTGFIETFFDKYCNMCYGYLEIKKEDIFEEYFKKWQKNMTRIKGDWTK